MVKRQYQKSSLHSFPIKKFKGRKKCTKKITNLPVEVLARIFQLLPAEQLPAIAIQCKSFRNATGLIVRQNFCKYKLDLENKINGLIGSLRGVGTVQNDSSRWDLCQKIGYTRVMKMKLSTLEAIIGHASYNIELWNLMALSILKAINEQENLLSIVLGFPYFIKDVRPRYVNSNMRSTEMLFRRYFTEIDPMLGESGKNEYFGIQIFNLLNTCQSANIRIVAFHPSTTDFSLISFFFEIRGLGRRFEIEDFKDFKDELKPNSKKLTDLKLYLYNILQHENSEFLFYQMERILSLESHLEYPNGQNFDDEILEFLENAYDTFLCHTYNELNHKKTKFYHNDTKIYKHEIVRQQEIRTCVSNVVLNLTFHCSRKLLPESIMFNNNDIGIYMDEEKDSVLNIISEYLSLQRILSNVNSERKRRRDTTAVHMDILISHNESQKSIIVTLKKLELNMNSKAVTFDIFEEDVSRFDELPCECHTNGTHCNEGSIFLTIT